MKKEELKKIKLVNASNIELICRCAVANNDNSNVILYCSGFGGTYGELGNVFSDYATEQGVTFAWGQFQDTYDIKESKQYTSDGSYKKIKIGATYSNLDCTKEDFDCFLNYLKSLGCKNLHIIATCVSCSKVVKYLLDGCDQDGLVKSLVLLAPIDLSTIKGRSKHAGLVEEARKYMLEGKPNELLSKYFLGYMPISASSYLDVCFNEQYNTLSYLSDSKRLEKLQQLNMPISFILAEKEGSVLKNGTLNSYECVDLLKSNCCSGYGEVIPNATHLFDGLEDQVVSKVDDFYRNQKEKFAALEIKKE
jgi:hypothetical protein